MSDSKRNAIIEGVTNQTAGFGLGAALGAVTKHAPDLTQRARGAKHPLTAIQIGQAMTAAAAGGATLNGTVAAGVGVVTAKIALVTAAATAAAPAVVAGAVVCGIVYGAWKLFK